MVVNTGCTFVGFNRIALGKRGLIASDVRIYTARYPVGLDERLTPVGIPEVIGAGSVVAENIQANSLVPAG